MSTHPSDINADTVARLARTRGWRFHIFDPSNYQDPRSMCGVMLDPSMLRSPPTKENLPQAVTCQACLRAMRDRQSVNASQTTASTIAGQDRFGHFVIFNVGTDREFRAAMPCSEIANEVAAVSDLRAACESLMDAIHNPRKDTIEAERAARSALAKARGEVGS